jgi:hypothetical protein
MTGEVGRVQCLLLQCVCPKKIWQGSVWYIATACCFYLSDSLVLIRPDPTESTTFVYDTFHVLLMGQYASVIIQTDNQSNHLLCLIWPPLVTREYQFLHIPVFLMNNSNYSSLALGVDHSYGFAFILFIYRIFYSELLHMNLVTHKTTKRMAVLISFRRVLLLRLMQCLKWAG